MQTNLNIAYVSPIDSVALIVFKYFIIIVMISIYKKNFKRSETQLESEKARKNWYE